MSPAMHRAIAALYAPQPEPNAHVHPAMRPFLPSINQGLSADPTKATRQIGSHNMNLDGR